MNIRLGLGCLAFVAALGAGASSAYAAPTARVSVQQAGDFVLIGNTLAHECRKSSPAPVVGDVGRCGTTDDTSSLPDSAPDIFWRADSPAPGRAEADVAITKDEARSAAVLELPEDAIVTHAFLYWSARNDAGIDDKATFDREAGFSQEVTAIQSWEVTVNKDGAEESHVYQSVADVTDLVQANGPGEYRVSGVDVSDIIDVDDARTYVGWWMVVLYEAPGFPERSLAVFDGLDRVSKGYPLSFNLDGVVTPDDGLEAKLGIVAFEGDNNLSGADQLFVNPSSSSPPADEAVSDVQNPANNFFNGTRSLLGVPVSVAGDLPQTTGTPQSLPGIDIDVVDVTSHLKTGMTSVPVLALSEAAEGDADLYFTGGWAVSIGPAPGVYPAGSGVFLCAARPGEYDSGARAPWMLGAAVAGGLACARRRARRR